MHCPFLQTDFVPWHKLYTECPKLLRMCAALERNHLERRENLLLDNDRRDLVAYKRVLLSIMKLFGQRIHEPLQPTMGNYLETADGKDKESGFEEWEKDRVNGVLCHNNAAERPFAVMKWLHRTYLSMTIFSLPHVAHAIINGTFTEGGGFCDCT